MNVVLFRKTIIVSSLADSEIVKRISEITDLNKSTWVRPNTAKQYVGKIEGNHFKIHRIVKGRNSFTPIIQGNVIDNLSTRKIELKMRLNFIVVLFLIWVSGLIVFGMTKTKDYNGLIFIGLLFGITIFFFNQECNKSTKDLGIIFKD